MAKRRNPKARGWTFSHGVEALKKSDHEDYITINLEPHAAFNLIDDMLAQLKNIMGGEQAKKRVRLNMVGVLKREDG